MQINPNLRLFTPPAMCRRGNPVSVQQISVFECIVAQQGERCRFTCTSVDGSNPSYAFPGRVLSPVRIEGPKPSSDISGCQDLPCQGAVLRGFRCGSVAAHISNRRHGVCSARRDWTVTEMEDVEKPTRVD